MTTEAHVETDLQIIDLRWGQDDPAPYLVPTPRVPCVGEKIVGPDDVGTLVVTNVTYVYDGGFYFAPTRVIVETEPHGR
jgi:hypothetical protein